MDNKINTSSEEGRKLLQKEVKALFISNMKALGHSSVKHGADIMPRSIWASALALALAERGVITAEQADGVAVVLSSELGNSSQLGSLLLKEGELTRETAANAATSLAEMLADRAKVKATS
jgi:hypothetical protein